MKKLMLALTMTAAGLMAAQTATTPDTATATPAKHGKIKIKKHRKVKKTTSPAATPSTPAK
ncbi:MAG: hypothetical protein ABL995_12180 [Bryobacteraceae bacterium]